MTHVEYYDLYCLILETIDQTKAEDLDQVLPWLNATDFIQSRLESLGPDLMAASLDIVENFIQEGLVLGRIHQSWQGPHYEFMGLTPNGQEFLSQIQEPSFRQIIIQRLDQARVPVKASKISKEISNVFWELDL